MAINQSRNVVNNKDYKDLTLECKEYLEADPLAFKLFENLKDACLSLYQEDILWYVKMIRNDISPTGFINSKLFM